MRRESRIRQHDRNDCAAACVASICAHYGLMLPMMKIREACGTGPDGTTMQGIIDAFGKLGFDAAGLKAKQKNILELQNISEPVIMHLEKKTGWLHFVVLYGIKGSEALVMDPEDGRMHRTGLSELEEEWSGYIVAATPSPEFKKGDSRTDIKGRIRELLVFHRKELLMVMTGSLACIAATLSTSVFIQAIIDRTIPSGDTGNLVMMFSAMLCLALLGWSVSYTRTVLLVRVSLKIDCMLIAGYFKKLFSLPVSFFDSMGSGDLNSRISDAYRIRAFITERLLLMAVSIATLAITAAVLTAFYWRLALVTLSLVPVFILIYTVSDKANRKINRKIIEENAKFEQSSIEWLSSARTVRYCNAGKEAAGKVAEKYFPMATAMYKGGVFTSAVTSASDAASKLVSIITLAAGAYFVLESELSVGELVSFFSLSTMLCSPILLLIESNRDITEARISAERLFDIMDLAPEDDAPTCRFTPKSSDTIEFRNVSFSYQGRNRLLEHLSFKIAPGKINLIYGPNGCGKSTVASLLMRGYKPQEGSITAGGIDINSISLADWRAFIAIVPQKTDIFDGSILDNIVMGKRDYDIRDVAAACAMAGLSGTVESIPGGLSAHTGEQACRLSGGERQKLALARALYRKPGALILDEASSHMDSGSKMMLYDTLSLLRDKNITIILISHDNDACQIADNIIDIKTNAHSEA